MRRAEVNIFGLFCCEVNLLVANEGAGTILRYDPAIGAFIGVFATGLNGPGPLTVGPDNNVYEGSGGNVLKFNGQTGASLGTFATGISSTGGLAFGPNGNLFTSSGVDSNIKQFNGTTGVFINNFASSAAFVNGAGPLCFYGGNLLVSQTFGTGGGASWGNAILKFDQTTGNFLGNFASDANLNGPSGMWQGPDGNLYVANYVGNNVLKYSPAGAFLGGADTSANGSQAPRFVTFSSAGSNPVPSTPAPSSLTLMMLAIAAISGWMAWRRFANRAAVR